MLSNLGVERADWCIRPLRSRWTFLDHVDSETDCSLIKFSNSSVEGAIAIFRDQAIVLLNIGDGETKLLHEARAC